MTDNGYEEISFEDFADEIINKSHLSKKDQKIFKEKLVKSLNTASKAVQP